MSKGSILSSIGDGLYRVRVDYAVDKVKAESERVAQRLLELEGLILTGEVAVLDAQAAVRGVVQQINQLIPAYQLDMPANAAEMDRFQVELVQAQRDSAAAENKLNGLTAERLALVKRAKAIDRIPEFKEAEAWCADLTTDLSGDVGLADVNDEGGAGVVVVPGFYGDALYDPGRDGALVPREAQSGAQVYLNAALLPGVQKWRPRYRVGEIQKIYGDLCDVELDAAISSAQLLDINTNNSFQSVPIQYMDCNSAAFEVGDRVLVRFFSSGPQVIGFEKNPRPCAEAGFYFVPSRYTQNFERQSWGEPFEDFDGQVNPPLGSSGGPNPAWSAIPEYRDSPYKLEKGLSEALAGNRNWIGGAGGQYILSWDGPPSRYSDSRAEGAFRSAWQQSWLSGSKVYYKLRVLVNLADYLSVGDHDQVCGAAIHMEGHARTLFVVATDADSPGPDFKLFSFALNENMETQGLPSLVRHFQCPGNTVFVSGWYFDAAGSKAVCTLRHYKAAPEDAIDYGLVYVCRLDVGLGFSIQTIYDREEDESTAVQSRSRSRTIKRESFPDGICGQHDLGPADIYRDDYSREGSDAQIDTPIYVEYVGAEEVVVYHRRPTVALNSDINQSQDLIAVDYPHPCAGQPDGSGGTFPDTFRYLSTNDTTIISNTTRFAAGPEQIVTSRGEILAELPFAQSRVNYSHFKLDRENVSFSASCGGMSINESLYTISYQRHEVEGSMNGFETSFAVDARSRFVVVGYNKTTLTMEASRTGSDPHDDSVDNNPDDFNTDRLMDLNTSVYTSRSEKFVSVFRGGSLVKKIAMADTLVDLGPTVKIGSGRFQIEAGYSSLAPPGCAGTAEDNTGPTTLTFPGRTASAFAAQHNLLDAAAVEARGRVGVSVLYAEDAAGAFSYQSLDQVGNPIEALFERSSIEPYTMHRLTVF